MRTLGVHSEVGQLRTVMVCKPSLAHQRLTPIPGSPPDMRHPPAGCPFAPRCTHAMAQCANVLPPVYDVEPGHGSRCWLHHPEAPRVEGVNDRELA